MRHLQLCWQPAPKRPGRHSAGYSAPGVPCVPRAQETPTPPRALHPTSRRRGAWGWSHYGSGATAPSSRKPPLPTEVGAGRRAGTLGAPTPDPGSLLLLYRLTHAHPPHRLGHPSPLGTCSGLRQGHRCPRAGKGRNVDSSRRRGLRGRLEEGVGDSTPPVSPAGPTPLPCRGLALVVLCFPATPKPNTRLCGEGLPQGCV